MAYDNAPKDKSSGEFDNPDEDEQYTRLDEFGASLAKTRSEAISARLASNIEEIWLEDEEFYEGVDDANRHQESRTNWRQKPPGQSAGLKDKTTRSTVFPNITGPFVDAAAARIADMLLPTDDPSFKIKPTPIPEMDNLAKGNVPREMQAKIDQQFPNPQQVDVHEKQIVAKAKMDVDAAKEKADAAQKRIEDWHVECQWHANVRLVIEDSARIGCGVLKGPVPLNKTRVTWQNGEIGQKTDQKPGSKWIDPWNFFPDGACGEDIHNGSNTWERDFITLKQLRELKKVEGYIEHQIDRCIQEGAQAATGTFKDTPDPVNDPERKGKYEIWYFHGTAEKEDLEVAGCSDESEGDDYKGDPHIPVMITMVNNHVIRASLNPLETGDFPYDVFVWRRRSGHWTGIGVARQIRVAQKIVTGGTRNLMDNAGLAAGVMLVYPQGKIIPADGVHGIAPRKIFFIAEDAEGIEDASKAFGVIKIDMLVDELLKIVQFGMKLAEDTTGLPMLLQGQMGDSPDTVGGMTMLNNNASAVLRRLARLFDDRITEPQVRRYYVWILQYGEENEKGDYLIDARGSSALVERDIQNKELGQMATIVLDPRFGKDPKKWMDEFLKSRHLDPKRFEYEDEEWEQVVSKMSQPAADPRTEIAQLKAQMDEKLKALDQQFEQQENQLNRDQDLLMRSIDAELDTMKLGGAKEMNLDKIKQLIADTTLKIRSTEWLVGMQAKADQLPKPPVEPPGRAPTGKSYTQ